MTVQTAGGLVAGSTRVHLFGLTGGVACGKSTVAARFAERGVPVVDADQLARDVVQPGTHGLAAVVAAFGKGVLFPDGTLDRKKLAGIVFDDGAARARLNAIVHPLIAARSAQRIGELDAGGAPLACYEAALLVENGMAAAFRPLVVVVAPDDARIDRAMRRDGATEHEVRARMAAQLPSEAKLAQADYVIDNAGDRAALLKRADEVLDAIRGKLGIR